VADDELSVEAAPERLRREAPELAKLADVLPKTRSELYAFLGLVLAATTLYITSRGDDSQEVHIRAEEVNVIDGGFLTKSEPCASHSLPKAIVNEIGPPLRCLILCIAP
jgi:hypothetical protein